MFNLLHLIYPITTSLNQIQNNQPEKSESDKNFELFFKKIVNAHGYDFPMQAEKIHDWLKIKDNLDHISKIKELDLRSGLESLTFLPAEIGLFKELETLNLNGNVLRSLPNEIEQLLHLKELHLARNRIEVFPKEILQLRSLKVLFISANLLSDLPKEIGNLSSLTILNLNGNRLKSLPQEIGQLSALSFLSLQSNEILNLPDTIEELTSLEEIDIRGNPIKTIPLKLKERLGHFHFKYDDPEMQDPRRKELYELDAYHKKLLQEKFQDVEPKKSQSKKNFEREKFSDVDQKSKTVPSKPNDKREESESLTFSIKTHQKEISEISPQKSFDDSYYNELWQARTFQPPIIQPKERVNPNDMQLGVLKEPENFDQALEIIFHAAEQKGHGHFPKTAKELRIWLNENENLEKLKMIESLNLSECQLTCLPPEIGKFKGLEELNLGNNLLTHLPGEIGELTNLTDLYLNNNQLVRLPEEIDQLAALQILDVQDNSLKNLPKEIGNLSHLEELNAYNNQLEDLPKEIEKLGKLRRLFLDSNQLKILPKEIKGLVLRKLYLRNNPLIISSFQDLNLTSLNWDIHL